MIPAMRLPVRARGMTLIEMMVAMTLGIFLTWGAIEVYAQSKRTYGSTESLARLQENARFALDIIEPDVQLAGFWGLHSVRYGQRAGVTNPAAAPVTVSCGGNDVTNWAFDFDTAVEVHDDNYDLLCPAHSAARAGSDVLIVRHASSETRVPQAGQPQVRSSLVGSIVFNDGAPPPPGMADVRDVVVTAYYVDQASSFVPGTPALRRLTLVNGGVLQDEELVPGVENMQVQYGVSTTPAGGVTRYVDANRLPPGAQIVAVRLWLLVRAEDAPDRSFTDTRTYTPPDADLPPITPGSADYPAAYRRLEVSRTFYLQNAR